ncbi:hypothetical protein JTB14_014651 [Gonioctena quinquepunctata]|nr:hypothetical protein JTB14_014651 [Gonioctena quinquepunctata]
MFKFFAIVFAAILAFAVAAPKPEPGLIATAPIAYSAYSAPLTYATRYSQNIPSAYPAYNTYAYPGYAYNGYAAPIVHY